MKIFALIAAALLLSVGGANATVTGGEQEVGLDIGAAIPNIQVGGGNSAASTGFLIGGQYIYQITPNIGVGVDVQDGMYGSQTFTVDEGGGHTGSIKTTSNALTYEVAGRYVFMPDNQWNPYAIVGVGGNDISLKATSAGGTLVNTSDQTFAFSVGAGVETTFMENWVGGLEARWRYMGIGSWDQTGGGKVDSDGMDEFTIAARIGYKWGGK